ncbi:S1C family serine protease [Natronobiforma cellulositropha]|uniref:S1C family serine protease n=1 Tax=Natronobiforma cellulositropha TaxID=1679076 RepID=UPI0021D5EC9E|nr:S1C family serine protease [Natronobiforma cellulositropha]
MDDHRLSRRRLLGATSAGLFGALAGCLAPQASNIAQRAPFPEEVGEDERAVDPDDRGSVYTDVYESVVDSVTFIRVFGIEQPFTEETGQGQGSGFLYDENHVVTNEHVVYGGEDIDVRYPTDDWAHTEVVGTDFYSDLAVLEVDTVPETAEPLALSEYRPAVGQEVLAIGNPFGLEGSMSQGIVSGVDRSLDMPGRRFTFPNVVQTDAAINPGNSGGPLVDMDGEVVGVINAGGGDNIGFAISAALARRVVPALIEDGEYHHSYMGVGLETVDPVIARANDLPEATGVIVASVEPDGPSDGVLRGRTDERSHHGDPIPVGGDVILRIDGDPTPDRHALSTLLALETSPGDTVPVDVYREGDLETVELTLAERPTPSGPTLPLG